MVQRHLHAIRVRLLSSPELSLYTTKIYIAHIYDVTEPVYPCITVRNTRGTLSTRVPRFTDPGEVEVAIHSQHSEQQALEIEEWCERLLHEQKQHVSTNQCCFVEIRKSHEPITIFDEKTAAWLVSTRYQIRARNTSP